MKLAIRYGNRAGLPQLKVGEGMVGYAAEHKTVVNVPGRDHATRATSRGSRTADRSWRSRC